MVSFSIILVFFLVFNGDVGRVAYHCVVAVDPEQVIFGLVVVDVFGGIVVDLLIIEQSLLALRGSSAMDKGVSGGHDDGPIRVALGEGGDACFFHRRNQQAKAGDGDGVGVFVHTVDAS